MFFFFQILILLIIKEGENDTYVEPPPIPAKITAPLKFYETDSEMFPEDLWQLELEEQRLKEEADDALRKKVIRKSLIFIFNFDD